MGNYFFNALSILLIAAKCIFKVGNVFVAKALRSGSFVVFSAFIKFFDIVFVVVYH